MASFTSTKCILKKTLTRKAHKNRFFIINPLSAKLLFQGQVPGQVQGHLQGQVQVQIQGQGHVQGQGRILGQGHLQDQGQSLGQGHVQGRDRGRGQCLSMKPMSVCVWLHVSLASPEVSLLTAPLAPITD